MSFEKRSVELTLNEAHVHNAIEKYLREIQMLHDDEDVKIEFEGPIPLKLVISKGKEPKEQEVTLKSFKI